MVEYIQELRQERERRYGVTVIGQLKRLHDLSAGAEDAGQFSAAINAERLRSALGGLTVDRRENIHQLDDLSREEITARLAQLRKEYPQAFIEGDYVEVKSGMRRTSGTQSRRICLKIVSRLGSKTDTAEVCLTYI